MFPPLSNNLLHLRIHALDTFISESIDGPITVIGHDDSREGQRILRKEFLHAFNITVLERRKKLQQCCSYLLFRVAVGGGVSIHVGSEGIRSSAPDPARRCEKLLIQPGGAGEIEGVNPVFFAADVFTP